MSIDFVRSEQRGYTVFENDNKVNKVKRSASGTLSVEGILKLIVAFVVLVSLKEIYHLIERLLA